MSVTAILTALQTRHAAVSGITSAPNDEPTSLNSGDLPCILTEALKGLTKSEAHDEDLILETRAYRVRCFCLPTGQGVGFTQGKQLAATVLDAVLASYRGSPVLTSTAAIRIEVGVEDTGVRSTMVYTDPEVKYYGFELLVSVEERWE